MLFDTKLEKHKNKFIYKDIDLDYNSKYLNKIIYPLVSIVFLLGSVGLILSFI